MGNWGNQENGFILSGGIGKNDRALHIGILYWLSFGVMVPGNIGAA